MYIKQTYIISEKNDEVWLLHISTITKTNADNQQQKRHINFSHIECCHVTDNLEKSPDFNNAASTATGRGDPVQDFCC